MSLSAPLTQSNPLYQFNQQFIEPAFGTNPWMVLPYKVAPGQAMAAGQIVAQETAVDTADVQTVTLSGGDGTKTFQLYVPLLGVATAAILDNATAATVQTALQLVVGAGNATVAGSAGGPYTITFAGTLAKGAMPVLQTQNVSAGLTVTIAHTTLGIQNLSIVAYGSGVVAAPTTALTLTDSSGAGTWPAAAYEAAYTYVNAQGETTLSPVAVYASAGTKKVHVAALSGIPAGVTKVNFYLNGYFAVQKSVASSAVAAFDFDMADLTAVVPVPPPTSNTAYTAKDGSQVPIGALQQAVYTDLYGNLALGTGPSYTGTSSTGKTVNVVIEGYLRTEQLTGLDANALKVLGRMITGSLSGPGVVHFR